MLIDYTFRSENHCDVCLGGRRGDCRTRRVRGNGDREPAPTCRFLDSRGRSIPESRRCLPPSLRLRAACSASVIDSSGVGGNRRLASAMRNRFMGPSCNRFADRQDYRPHARQCSIYAARFLARGRAGKKGEATKLPYGAFARTHHPNRFGGAVAGTPWPAAGLRESFEGTGRGNDLADREFRLGFGDPAACLASAIIKSALGIRCRVL